MYFCVVVYEFLLRGLLYLGANPGDCEMDAFDPSFSFQDATSDALNVASSGRLLVDMLGAIHGWIVADSIGLLNDALAARRIVAQIRCMDDQFQTTFAREIANMAEYAWRTSLELQAIASFRCTRQDALEMLVMAFQEFSTAYEELSATFAKFANRDQDHVDTIFNRRLIS